jgi:alkylhydroperoxidase family enzyme
MARIADVELQEVEPSIRKVLEAQRVRWGGPLLNHLLYARVPAIFRAVRAMWSGIDSAGGLDEGLKALVNRRVAWLNGCAF